MHISFVFFGSSPFSAVVLRELVAAKYAPTLIINDARAPLDAATLRHHAPSGGWDVFIVASFGRIISAEILAIPKHGSLNVHPSLLPKYRGSSPIQSAILADDRNTGVSIMQMDAELDHGPIVASKKVPTPHWPPNYDELEKILGTAGGTLLANILPDWCTGKITAHPQDHVDATYTKKIVPADGDLPFDPTTKNLAGDPYQNFLKIQAFARWPKAHFFIERKGRRQRILITKAHYENNTLIIERVVPEGKQEMQWPDFAKGYL